MKPRKGDEALRRFRTSIPGASYFITICAFAAAKDAALNSPDAAAAIRAELAAMEESAVWQVRSGVIMPDHLHLLARLGPSLHLSRAIARFKSRTKQSLESAGLKWQENFYEHRLRADNPVESVIRYIQLNPYEAGIESPNTSYPHFWLGPEESAWFDTGRKDGGPLPCWLK